MLGSVLRALQHTLRALMRLLTQRTDAPADAQRAAVGGAEARGATLDDGSGWFIPYEDPLVFPSATLKSAESRCVYASSASVHRPPRQLRAHSRPRRAASARDATRRPPRTRRGCARGLPALLRAASGGDALRSTGR
jgi:hypothetical protein